jgi:hypothetical protein
MFIFNIPYAIFDITSPIVAMFRLCNIEYRVWNIKYELRSLLGIFVAAPEVIAAVKVPASARKEERFSGTGGL